MLNLLRSKYIFINYSYLITSGLSTNKCLSYKETVVFNLKNKCPARCDDLTFKKSELKAKVLS